MSIPRLSWKRGLPLFAVLTSALYLYLPERNTVSSDHTNYNMAAAAPQSALVIGATGAVGRHVLHELLLSPKWSRVGEYGRRVTPDGQLGLVGVSAEQKQKLEQKAIDFEKVEQEGLKDGKWDVVFITLGTTAKTAGSTAAFEKIDREYVINSAQAAKTDDPEHKQRLVYLSSFGSNPKSFALYPRSKGLTEQGLAALGYSDTIVFRPGFLKNADRGEFRLAESIFGGLTGVLSHFTPTLEIDVARLGKAIRVAGQLGSQDLPASAEAETREAAGEGKTYVALANKGAIKLAEVDA